MFALGFSWQVSITSGIKPHSRLSLVGTIVYRSVCIAIYCTVVAQNCTYGTEICTDCIVNTLNLTLLLAQLNTFSCAIPVVKLYMYALYRLQLLW